MNELKEYQYLHHPLLGLNQRDWWREQSRPPMLNRASFSQKSEMRLCRKQELINGNRPSSITFPTIMYLPGILSAYMLHFPTQNLESNLRDSVKLTTDPTSSVMKHCERETSTMITGTSLSLTEWGSCTYMTIRSLKYLWKRRNVGPCWLRSQLWWIFVLSLQCTRG